MNFGDMHDSEDTRQSRGQMSHSCHRPLSLYIFLNWPVCKNVARQVDTVQAVQ